MSKSSIGSIDRALSGATISGESRPRTTVMKSTASSPKFQYHRNLLIRLYSVIYRTLVRGVLPLCRDAVGVFYPTPAMWADHEQDMTKYQLSAIYK